MIEGRKHYSLAKRHTSPLSVMAFRVDSYGDIAKSAGKDVADQLLAKIAKLVSTNLRTEDSIGRAAETTFIVVSGGPAGAQVMALARRLHDQMKAAQVAYRGQTLKIVSSFGIASLGNDQAAGVEDLIKL